MISNHAVNSAQQVNNLTLKEKQALNPAERALMELHRCAHWVTQTQCLIFHIFCSYKTNKIL